MYECVCVFLQSVIHSHCDSQRNDCDDVAINMKLDEEQSKRVWSAIKVCVWFVGSASHVTCI